MIKGSSGAVEKSIDKRMCEGEACGDCRSMEEEEEEGWREVRREVVTEEVISIQKAEQAARELYEDQATTGFGDRATRMELW